MTLAPGFIIRGESVTRYSTIKINKINSFTVDKAKILLKISNLCKNRDLSLN